MSPKTPDLRIDERESQRFQIVSAKFDGTAHVFPDLNEIDAEARAKSVQFISTRVNCSDLDRIHALETAGYLTMDTLVYFERSLKNALPELTSNPTISIRAAIPEDTKPVGRIAGQAFKDYLGHFHADPKLDSNAADAVYVDWAMSCVANQSETAPILVAVSDQKVVGFIASRFIDHDHADITLNAVDPAFQGQGVYNALLHHMCQLCSNADHTRIIISTQVNNYRVQRVWVRLGFSPYRALTTFHKWIA